MHGDALVGRGAAPASAPVAVGLLLAPLAIAGVHLGLGYTLASLHCHLGFLSFELFGLTALRVAIVATTLLALLLVLVLAAVGVLLLLRRDPAAREGADGVEREGRGPALGLLVLVAVLLDILAVLYLLWTFLPILSVELC